MEPAPAKALDERLAELDELVLEVELGVVFELRLALLVVLGREVLLLLNWLLELLSLLLASGLISNELDELGVELLGAP